MSTRQVSIGLVVFCGCSQPSAPTVAPQPKLMPTAVSTTADQRDNSSPHIDESTYPEKSSVSRLIHRARRLKEDGKFIDALAVTEDALIEDPHSPAAQTLREAILRIVEKSWGESHDAQ